MVYLPHWPTSNKSSIVANNGFDGIASILKKLGNPHQNLPPTIHIAGTNGKGSTAAFLSAIFQAANYKTHILTSPHIHHTNERITIANKQISDGYLYEMLEEVRIAAANQPLSLFEGLTLAAILAFSKNKADICIIETGMGGRVDITNVIDDKILTIITAISLDHMEYLGNHIAAIAAEKSHIMRSKIPSIIAHQIKEAGAMIEMRSAEIGNPLIHYGDNFEIEINLDESFNFSYQRQKLNCAFNNLPKPALLGQHQYLNAANAIAGVLAIKEFKMADFEINQTQIAQGLKSVNWPLRLERINNNLNKLLKNKESEIWIDGAHNIGGAYILANWLKEKNLEDLDQGQQKINYLITGFTKGKAEKLFFDQFKNIVSFICPVRVEGEPNPENAQIIEEQINKSNCQIHAKAQDDLADAVAFLANLNSDYPCRILICGSLYLGRDLKQSNLMLSHL